MSGGKCVCVLSRPSWISNRKRHDQHAYVRVVFPKNNTLAIHVVQVRLKAKDEFECGRRE
jgi:hypothetical protein